jgi:hypothetical protein
MAYRSEMRHGDRIVGEIEHFREVHARLPDPARPDELLPLGFKLRISYQPEYRLTGDNDYEIEYYIGFDGPRIIYSSATRQWRCELCN